MYKKIYLIISLLVILILVGCNTKLGSDEFNREGLKEFYIEGKYSEKLKHKQEKLLGQDKVYFKIIENKKDFDQEVEEYSLFTPRQTLSLNYSNEYFKDKSMLLIYPSQDAENISYWVKDINKKDGEIKILIEKYIPDELRTEIVNHGLLVEMYKNAYSNKDDFNVVVQEVQPNDMLVDEQEQNLAGISLGMTKQDVSEIINNNPIEVEELEFEGITFEHVVYNGLEVIYIKNKVVMILINSSNFLTDKGLKVGDTLSKTMDIYGSPTRVNQTQLEGFDKYIYQSDRERELFIVINKDNKVERIQLDNSQYIN